VKTQLLIYVYFSTLILILALFFQLFIIYFSLSLWVIYFVLELNYMLLAVLFIIGSSIFRGLFNYIFINSILSIGFIIGIVILNSLFLIISSLGKIGFYPFFLIQSMLYYNSSYIFLSVNLINYLLYFNAIFLVIYY